MANVDPFPSVATCVTLGCVGAAGITVETAVMAKLTAPDVPPPGVGLNTVTGTEPVFARSAEVMAARS